MEVSSGDDKTFFFLDTVKTVVIKDFRGKEWEKDYKGEIDYKGRACGLGETEKFYHTGKEIYKGNFLNDTYEGIGK